MAFINIKFIRTIIESKLYNHSCYRKYLYFGRLRSPLKEQQNKLEESLPMTEKVAPAPIWLEEVEGEQALAKVQAWNKVTLDKLMADKRYAQYLESGLEIVNAKDKIPYGTYRGGYIYNFGKTIVRSEACCAEPH